MSHTANADATRSATDCAAGSRMWAIRPEEITSGDLLEHVEPADHRPRRVRLARVVTDRRRHLAEAVATQLLADHGGVLGEPDSHPVDGHV
jgi:hypothetical protein